jgi:hypothetical protein
MHYCLQGFRATDEGAFAPLPYGPPCRRPASSPQTSHLQLRLLSLSELARTLSATRACHAVCPHAADCPIPPAALATSPLSPSGAAALPLYPSGARETKKLTKKLDCGLIYLIIEGFFAKRSTEDPNQRTLAYFIIR